MSATATTARSVGFLCLVLASAAGCSQQTTGELRAQGDPPNEKRVEWVTDPEGNSPDPEFISVLISGDGDFVVGADFPPGLYKSQGSRDGARCTWFRVATDPKGSFQVLESGQGSGSQRVTVESTDELLRSSGCLPWSKVTQ